MKTLFLLSTIVLTILLNVAVKPAYLTKTNAINNTPSSGQTSGKLLFCANATRYANTLFVGIRNNVRITHNINDAILVEVDNGTIEKIGKTSFIIHPEKIGSLTLTLYKIKDNTKELFGKQSFRVLNIPPPIIKFDGKTFYQIPKKTLISTDKFTCNQAPHFEYNIKYEIVALTFKVLRNNNVIMAWKQEGAKLTELTKQNLSKTTNNDLLMITKAIVKHNKNIIELNPLIYKIKTQH